MSWRVMLPKRCRAMGDTAQGRKMAEEKAGAERPP